jgi:transposase
MSRVITLEDREIRNAIDAYLAGTTLEKISERLGVHRVVARRILAEHGVTIRLGTILTITQAQQEKATELYQSGIGISEIAKVIGCKRSTLRYFLVGRHQRPGKKTVASTIPSRRKEKIISLYRQGMSRNYLGKKFNLTWPVISALLAESGTTVTDGRKRFGPEHPNYRGGRHARKDGYVFVWIAPDDEFAEMRNCRGRVAEHRIVMARKLGRPLLKRERVHHKNGDKQDNREENLELWMDKHPPGQRHDEGIPHCPTCTCQRH